MSPDRATYESLWQLARPERQDRRATGDYIRFELLIDVIRDVVDPDLNLLEFVDLFHHPNHLHYAITRRALDGAVLLTTNFDDLFERALLGWGARPATICSEDDFVEAKALRTSNYVPVYKLHGSYRRYRGEDCELAKDTIQATLSSITQGVDEFLLPPPKADALARVLADRELLVVGYSGSDDLDVMPTLLQTRPQLLTWLEYRSGSPIDITSSVLTECLAVPRARRSPRQRLFVQQYQNPRQGQVLAGSPLKVLQARFGSTNPPEPMPDGDVTDMGVFLRRWETRMFSSLVQKQLVVAEILQRLSRTEEAHAWLNKALLKAEGPEQEANIRRLLSKTALQMGDLPQGLAFIEQAVQRLPKEVTDEERLPYLHQLAFSLYRNGAFDQARVAYEKALETSRCLDHPFWAGNSSHDLGMIYLDTSRWEEAKRHFEQAIRLSRQAGDLRHVGWSLYELGILSFEQGDFAEVASYLEESRSIAELLGDVSHLAFIEHAYGLLAFLRGDIVEAFQRFGLSLELDARTGNQAFSGMSVQHLGVVGLEESNYRFAERCFLEAERRYRDTGDAETLSELFGYRAQLHLDEGRLAEARKAAERAVNQGKDQGLDSYLCRAEAMLAFVGLATDEPAGEALVAAVEKSGRLGRLPLLMDLVSLAFRYGHGPRLTAELPDRVAQCRDAYEGLANRRRLDWMNRSGHQMLPAVG